MVKFIIVEDEEKYQKEIKEVINKLMFNNNQNYELKIFDSYNLNLKKEILDCSISKIYIMDIALKTSLSGIDIAKKIREDDWDSEIIFITNHDKMFEQVHRETYKIFDFIEKFYDCDERLFHDLKIIINKKYDKSKFLYSNAKIDFQIYLKDILYIYRDTYERKMIIKTNNNSFKINMGVDELLSKLDNRFKKIHRACIVNEDMVESINWSQNYFILTNGEKVNLCSRNYRDLDNE